jgi:hypothetical protein
MSDDHEARLPLYMALWVASIMAGYLLSEDSPCRLAGIAVALPTLVVAGYQGALLAKHSNRLSIGSIFCGTILIYVFARAFAFVIEVAR